MRDPVPAIVFAYGLNGLGAVRSLGVAGIPVIAIGASPSEPGLRSRYCLETVVLPDNGPLEVRFDRALAPWAGRGLPLIPTSDPAAEFLSANRSRLAASFRLALPPREALSALIDKRVEYELVQAAGVPMPRTVTRLSGDLEQSLEPLGFPLILKPRTLGDNFRLGFKNVVVRSRDELLARRVELGARAELLVAQEVIAGADDTLWVCNATFGPDSRPLCAMSFQRLGLSPPHFGVTTMARSTDNPVVKDYSARLAKQLGWVGPCMFEFKWDAGREEYQYIEINPRLGMCNWFDTRCGVNNVLATYLLALGRESEIADSGQSERRFFLSLLPDAFARIEDGESLWALLRRYAGMPFRRCVGGHFYWRDPRPGLDHLLRQAKRVFSYLSRRAGALPSSPEA